VDQKNEQKINKRMEEEFALIKPYVIQEGSNIYTTDC
jgi:hypothetical protein